MSDPALRVRNLSKSFNGRTVLRDFDLDIAAGEIHALVGENGSGKSTLIKVLAGYHDPDAGSEIDVAGNRLTTGSPHSSYGLGCRFVHQDLGLIEDASVLDNVLLNTGYPTRLGSIRTRKCRASVAEDLARVGLSLSPGTMVRDLSPATKTAVAVARALRPDTHSNVHFLVFDEPTATLPDDEVTRLLTLVRAVASRGIGVLYVTHRLAEIFEIADNVTVLRNGSKVNTVPVREVTRPKLINMLVGREFQEIGRASDELDTTGGDAVLEVRGLRSSTLRNVSFEAAAGELVGIAGITGSGAESFLATVYGGIARDAGEVMVAGAALVGGRPDLAVKAGVAYMPPDRKVSGGFLEQNARENMTITSLAPFRRKWGLSRRREVAEVKQWFEDLSVRPADGADNLFATFSGGNQQKVLFAKWLRLRPALFLLDEPTQGVDIGAKGLLHHQLIDAAARGMTIVVQSTDVEELAVLCQRVIVIRDGRIAADLRGDDVTVAHISSVALGTEHESVA